MLVFHIGNSVFILFTGNIMLCGFKIKQLYIYLFSRLTLTCSSSFSFSFWNWAALSSASAQASCSCDTQISNVHLACVAGAAREGNKYSGERSTRAPENLALRPWKVNGACYGGYAYFPNTGQYKLPCITRVREFKGNSSIGYDIRPKSNNPHL